MASIHCLINSNVIDAVQYSFLHFVTLPAIRDGPLIIQERGAGPWSNGPIFFFAEIFSRNENFWTEAWPDFFSLFTIMLYGGKSMVGIFIFSKILARFFFGADARTDFFSFSDPPWMINGPPLSQY